MTDKSKNILLGVLIVGLVSMTVAYAALSTTLTINGTAEIPATKWDVEITDWTDATPGTGYTGKVNTATHPAATVSSTAITNLAVTLNQPGDQAVYTFNVTNKGTIDAKLASKSVGCKESAASDAATVACPEAITYTISCAEGAQTENDTLSAAASDTTAGWNKKACTLTVKYNDATNTGGGVYNQSSVTAHLYATWLYEQNNKKHSVKCIV